MDCSSVIKPDTLLFYVDDVQVPLKPISAPEHSYLIFETTTNINVDINTGKTVKLQVVPVGFTILNYDRPITGCTGGYNKWMRITDLPEQCWFNQNPITMEIPAGPAYYNPAGIAYYGVANTLPVTCGFLIKVGVNRYGVPITCDIKCGQEAVSLQTGSRLQGLMDDRGKLYLLPGSPAIDCNEGSTPNLVAAAAIKNLILSNISCKDPGVEVSITPNGTNPNCVTLLIKNTPIKFGYVKVNDQFLNFSTVKC